MRLQGALIVGGGPAGAAAAITLARAGAPHLLVERNRETGDALCGGFLSWRTLETLRGLGIDADTLNSADITRVRLFAGDRMAEARLPRPAKAVSRRRLDSLMLDRAASAGARIERGVAVRAIDGIAARVDGDEIAADALFLASGKHDVRGIARPVDEDDPTLGLRVRLTASPTLSRLVNDAVELHLFDRGYAGIALQEDGSANVCLAVRRSRLREAGTPYDLLRDLAEGPLGERLAALDTTTQIDAVANVPYGWRLRDGIDGLFRLGDQAGVIPSLAGEGMGIAIASGISAANAYLAGETAPVWQRRFSQAIARPIRIADIVRHAVERPVLARAAIPIAHLAPRLIQIIARATRIGHRTS